MIGLSSFVGSPRFGVCFRSGIHWGSDVHHRRRATVHKSHSEIVAVVSDEFCGIYRRFIQRNRSCSTTRNVLRRRLRRLVAGKLRTSQKYNRRFGWQAFRNHPGMRQVRVGAASKGLLRDQRGTAFTEYLAIVGLFGIVVGAILTTRAQTLVVDYANARDLVLLPAL